MRALRLLAPLPALLLAAPLAATEPASTPVTFKTADGFTLHGTLTVPATGPKRHPVVILAHQFHSDRAAWAPLAERLNARGIATLALDLRGHGESTDKGGAAVAVTDDFAASAKAVGFDQIPGDLALVAAWARKQKALDPRRVALAGSSVGGFSVLAAAGKVKPLAVLALSPAGSEAFGDHALESVGGSLGRSGAATLVFVAQDDADAAKVAAAVKAVPGVSELVFPGQDHGYAFFKDHAETMAVFFGEYLLHAQALHKGGPAPADATKGQVVTPATLAASPAAQGQAPAPPPAGN